MKKGVINEIFFIRAFACLMVVFIHSITATIANNELNIQTQNYMHFFQLFLMFATPLFIFISEFVLSYMYHNHVPKHFFRKRVKFILIPYAAMGFFYSFVQYIRLDLSVSEFLNSAFKTVFTAGFHGYFIIIIFQFYLLHVYGRNLLNKMNAKLVIPVSFLITFGFLYTVNFVEPPAIPNAEFYWYEFSRVLFPGWLFYFAVAFYTGKNYTEFKSWLKNNPVIVFGLFFFSACILALDYKMGILTVPSSKRVDIILYTMSIFLLLFYVFSHFKTVPKFVKSVSNYSFGIYLLHPFYQSIVTIIYMNQEYRNFGVYLLLTFVGAIAGSIITTAILNQLPFGKYLVGKVSIPSLSVIINNIKEKSAKQAA